MRTMNGNHLSEGEGRKTEILGNKGLAALDYSCVWFGWLKG